MPKDNETEKQEKITPVSIKNYRQVFIIEIFLFILTLGLGIAAAFRINQILAVQKITLPQVSSPEFIIYFILGTLFLFLISHFLKLKKEKSTIFRLIFIFVVFFGGSLFLQIWISDILALVLMGFLVLWWVKKPSVLIQDICMILAIAGVGSSLGVTFTPLAVVFLLIIFSIYDFIAVYKTKHMVKMAKEMIENKAILALVIPQTLYGFKENLGKIKLGGQFLILGGGDVIFPLLLSASLIPQGVINSFIVAIFSVVGLSVSFYIFSSQKFRQAIPALPPIALFSIIGFLITLII